MRTDRGILPCFQETADTMGENAALARRLCLPRARLSRRPTASFCRTLCCRRGAFSRVGFTRVRKKADQRYAYFQVSRLLKNVLDHYILYLSTVAISGLQTILRVRMSILSKVDFSAKTPAAGVSLGTFLRGLRTIAKGETISDSARRLPGRPVSHGCRQTKLQGDGARPSPASFFRIGGQLRGGTTA